MGKLQAVEFDDEAHFLPTADVLLWVYFSWLVTLVAAMMTANLALTRRRPAGKPTRA
jgi:hypothetical protein